MQEHFKGYVYFDNPNFDKNAINAVDAVRITVAKNICHDVLVLTLGNHNYKICIYVQPEWTDLELPFLQDNLIYILICWR